MTLVKRTPKPKTKLCTKCGKTRPRSEFNKQRAARDGFSCWCRPCASAYNKHWYTSEDGRARSAAYRKDHPEQIKKTGRQYIINAVATIPNFHRRKNLQRLYGITLEDYDCMLKKQGGGCAICGVKPKKRAHAVDHDHATGKIRGILCHMCNRGLAFFRDNPERLQKATEYLRK